MRYPRWSESRQVIIQHRQCLRCGQRFRTRQPPPVLDGLDRMLEPRKKPSAA